MLKIANLIFSILLLPFSIYCSFWIINRVLRLAKMTPKEFMTNEELYESIAGYPKSSFYMKRHMARRAKTITRFLTEKTGEPELAKKSIRSFAIVTLIGSLSFPMAIFATVTNNEKQFYLSVALNILLLIYNLIVLGCGKKYYNDNPIDERTQEILNQKREIEKEDTRKNRTKNIIVYGLVGAFFIGIIVIPLSLHSNLLSTPPISPIPSITYEESQNKISHDNFIKVLEENGFTTREIPVTYWQIREDDLMFVSAGIKDNTKFEYYEYSQGINTESVFDEIANAVCDAENFEYNQSYTESSDGAYVVEIEKDDKYSVVINKFGKIIYAYSDEKDDNITDILNQLGINI